MGNKVKVTLSFYFLQLSGLLYLYYIMIYGYVLIVHEEVFSTQLQSHYNTLSPFLLLSLAHGKHSVYTVNQNLGTIFI